MMIKTIVLYGHASCCVKAKSLLENLPFIRRVDIADDEKKIKLFLDKPVEENTLIPLLANSGISGFRVL